MASSSTDGSNVVAATEAKGKGLAILERNIAGVPVTENQLRKLYDAFTVGSDGDGVSVEVLVAFYNSLDQLGVPRTEREVRSAVLGCAQADAERLTYDEFACFMLRISQW